MNPIVDTIMLIAFVAFMVFIFRGYHTKRLEQIEEEMDKERDENAAASSEERKTS